MPRKTTENKKTLFERLDKCLIWEAALLGKQARELEDVYAPDAIFFSSEKRT